MPIIRCDESKCENNEGGYCQLDTVDMSTSADGKVTCDDVCIKQED